MTKTPLHIVRRQRRHKKIRSNMSGTADKPRLVVYKSNTSVYAQLVNDNKGHVLCAITDLKVKAKNKTERAQVAGKILAETAVKKEIKTCVFDRNGYKYIGRV